MSDDAHRHAGLDGMEQESGVDGFADRIVAAERKRNIGNPAAYPDMRQRLHDRARGLDVVDGVVAVFFDPGRDREDVGIEHDVLRRKVRFLQQ